MAGAIMNKVWDLFGMDTAEKEEEYDDVDEVENEVEKKQKIEEFLEEEIKQ